MTFQCRIPVWCECGDQLIHQNRRGIHESSSLLGQHIHDRYPVAFDYMDIDGAIWKMSTRRLVVIEHKYPGQMLRSSQKRVLPLFGAMVELAIKHELINSGGAYLLYGAPPFVQATVTKWPGDITRDLNQTEVDAFLQGNTIGKKVLPS